MREEYKTYGCLYDWEKACDICPDGWHLPSDDEWKELEMYLGMSEEEVNILNSDYLRGGNAGDYIKIGPRCTNVTGFSALWSGIRDTYYDEIFVHEGRYARYYTSIPTDYGEAYTRELCWTPTKRGIRIGSNMYNGYSVRCIKDKPSH